MKVLLIGANGQIGKHVVELAKEDEDISITAMVRKKEQLEDFKKNGTEAVLADLEGSVKDLEQAMEGANAVVFTAGSGGNTGADKTILVDLDGAIKAVEAAERAGVERFVMISAFQANNREYWKESPIKHYMAAKHYADRYLMNSKLNYTIIRPGNLRNEPGIGKIKAGELSEYGAVPREDVARTVIESLKSTTTHHLGFDLLSGDNSVKEAIKNL
jgi:uncharacterized protein YbjT (DUF2867 family)